MRARSVLLAFAAGLALADASIVTLALPRLLVDLDTTVQGVAAVIGVYTIVLAASLLGAEQLMRRHGPQVTGAAGFGLFAVASLVCALAGSLTVLLVGRGVQAAGGAAGLVAVYALLVEHPGAAGAPSHAPGPRALWLGTAVLSAAVGPALGGALTQAFSWQAIFFFQAPVAALAALACRAAVTGGAGSAGMSGATPAEPRDATPGGATATGGPPTGVALSDAAPRDAAPGAAVTHPTSTSAAVTGLSSTSAAPPGAAPKSAAPPATAPGAAAPSRVTWAPAVALALVSAALTAVLFLLVLLLVAGWAVSPLRAAVAVTLLPAAALAGARVRGDARWRAAAGCLLVGVGTWALAYLPDARIAWTLAPQAFAGFGMGLALPALGGELLGERTARDAAALLTIRHVGIAIALAILAPVTAARLDDATRQARERGVALVLDARLDPAQKLRLAPALLAGVGRSSPRAELRRATAAARQDVAGDQRAEYDRMTARADDTLVGAVGDSFFPAFAITGAFAVLAALALALGGARGPAPPVWAAAASVLAIAALGGQIVAWRDAKPPEVVIRDPCRGRPLPGTGGIGGFLQDRALQALDRRACDLHASREELVLAIADPADARRFEREHGTNPRSLGSLLDTLLG